MRVIQKEANKGSNERKEVQNLLVPMIHIRFFLLINIVLFAKISFHISASNLRVLEKRTQD